MEQGETRRTLDAPVLSFNLDDEIRRLREGPQWERSGHAAVTLVKNADVRIVLVLLAKGRVVHEHHAEGPVTVAVPFGGIRFRAQGEERVLQSGALLTLGNGIVHEIEALEESAFVVTVIQPRHPA